MDHVAALESAIDRLTAALGTAPDDTIAELVTERAAMRAELRALQEGANVVALDSKRGRR